MSRFQWRTTAREFPNPSGKTSFQPFVTYGKEEGTGLGLAVVQKIVRDHGGEVKVEATGKSGTTFKVVLPLKRPTQPSDS